MSVASEKQVFPVELIFTKPSRILDSAIIVACSVSGSVMRPLSHYHKFALSLVYYSSPLFTNLNELINIRDVTVLDGSYQIQKIRFLTSDTNSVQTNILSLYLWYIVFQH